MTTAEKYVTAAYLAVLAAVLLYVVIYTFKLQRLEREIGELSELARRRPAGSAQTPQEAGREAVPET
jgi:hypothetical protein